VADTGETERERRIARAEAGPRSSSCPTWPWRKDVGESVSRAETEEREQASGREPSGKKEKKEGTRTRDRAGALLDVCISPISPGENGCPVRGTGLPVMCIVPRRCRARAIHTICAACPIHCTVAAFRPICHTPPDAMPVLQTIVRSPQICRKYSSYSGLQN
jgi:hypothetical protein